MSGQYRDSVRQTPLESQVFDDVPSIPPFTYRGLYLLGKLKWQPVSWQRVTLLMQGDPLAILVSLPLSMIGVLWAYEGWQYVTFSAGETINAQRAFRKLMRVRSRHLEDWWETP